MRIAPLANVKAKLMSFSPKLRRFLDQAAANARAGHKLSHDEFWGEVGRLYPEEGES